MTHHRSAVGVALLLAASPLTGCHDEGTPEIKPASSVDVAKKDELDRDSYCTAMCERSATCGMEQATRLASKVDQTALDEAKQKHDADRNECVASCGKSQLPPHRVAQAKSALACTKRESCDAFATCLEEVATP